MEAVNGVSEVDKGGPPAPSPLTGCYLLIVVGEPHSKEHKDIILRRIAKGLLSWDVGDCHVDLEKELAIITEQAPEGEDARYGERLIQFASENLVTEILIHPAISTLSQCMKNLLSSFTRHRHIIHAGYTFAANGSWILQDGTLSLTDFSEAFQEIEVQRVLRAYDSSISLDIHCSPEGDWTRLPKESFTKNCKVRVNPDDVLTSGSPPIVNFLNYISPFLVPTDMETLLESSDVVGNIRFSHPTLYVFPGGQGDAALFGINGFNMLVDGGFARKACFWDFVRHLDRLDAVLLTRLNNSNVNGISSVLRRKRFNTVYPQIGHFFCNIQERKAILSPDGDKDKDPLIVNLLEEGQEIVSNLRQLHLQPQSCYRDVEPINLYHKVGHGTLDMYVLSPAKESKEVREFIQKWNTNDQRLFANQRNGRDFSFPTQNLVSVCALLVWQPANANDSITRILFPGSTPQHKIFEGLDRLKQLECIKYPSCSAKTLTPSLAKSKQAKVERLLQQDQKENKTRDKIVQQVEAKAKIENKVAEENIKNIQSNGVAVHHVITEKIIKKHDSTESEKSGPQSGEPKKLENGKEPTQLTNGKPSEEKTAEKPKPKAKIDQKPKVESKVFKHTRSIERKPKQPIEKKASPTTPKKTLDSKINGETKSKTAVKVSPSATPAKSAKEANNRKVVESKYKVAPKKEVSKPEKKDPKPERKPISRRPKETSPTTKAAESPVKKLNELHKVEARKSKLEKEGTTDSSTVSTPSADVETAKKDISKLTPEELDQLKAREIAELKEEQEVVKEIEAVFRKSEQKVPDNSELRKVKNISVEEKTEGEGEEYLIIEKEEVEHDSLDEKEVKESETQKHLRDSEESEKQRKLSDGAVVDTEVKEEKPAEVPEPTEPTKIQESQAAPTTIEIDKAKDEKEHTKELSKEASAASPDDKVDVSSGKKITDRDGDEENKDANILESQPDEKFSTPIESGATTAPTLPEDERIPLDEIKEDNGDQAVEEKYVKEDTKEKEIPIVELPPKTADSMAKLPTIVGIRLDKQTPIRDLVKTPDEVADLPVHEEVDIENYERYQATQAPKQDETKHAGADKDKEPAKIGKEPPPKHEEKVTVDEQIVEKKSEVPEKSEVVQQKTTDEQAAEPIKIGEDIKTHELPLKESTKSDLVEKPTDKLPDKTQEKLIEQLVEEKVMTTEATSREAKPEEVDVENVQEHIDNAGKLEDIQKVQEEKIDIEKTEDEIEFEIVADKKSKLDDEKLDEEILITKKQEELNAVEVDVKIEVQNAEEANVDAVKVNVQIEVQKAEKEKVDEQSDEEKMHEKIDLADEKKEKVDDDKKEPKTDVKKEIVPKTVEEEQVIPVKVEIPTIDIKKAEDEKLDEDKVAEEIVEAEKGEEEKTDIVKVEDAKLVEKTDAKGTEGEKAKQLEADLEEAAEEEKVSTEITVEEVVVEKQEVTKIEPQKEKCDLSKLEADKLSEKIEKAIKPELGDNSTENVQEENIKIEHVVKVEAEKPVEEMDEKAKPIKQAGEEKPMKEKDVAEVQAEKHVKKSEEKKTEIKHVEEAHEKKPEDKTIKHDHKDDAEKINVAIEKELFAVISDKEQEKTDDKPEKVHKVDIGEKVDLEKQDPKIVSEKEESEDKIEEAKLLDVELLKDDTNEVKVEKSSKVYEEATKDTKPPTEKIIVDKVQDTDVKHVKAASASEGEHGKETTVNEPVLDLHDDKKDEKNIMQLDDKPKDFIQTAGTKETITANQQKDNGAENQIEEIKKTDLKESTTKELKEEDEGETDKAETIEVDQKEVDEKEKNISINIKEEREPAKDKDIKTDIDKEKQKVDIVEDLEKAIEQAATVENKPEKIVLVDSEKPEEIKELIKDKVTAELHETEKNKNVEVDIIIREKLKESEQLETDTTQTQDDKVTSEVKDIEKIVSKTEVKKEESPETEVEQTQSAEKPDDKSKAYTIDEKLYDAGKIDKEKSAVEDKEEDTGKLDKTYTKKVEPTTHYTIADKDVKTGDEKDQKETVLEKLVEEKEQIPEHSVKMLVEKIDSKDKTYLEEIITKPTKGTDKIIGKLDEKKDEGKEEKLLTEGNQETDITKSTTSDKSVKVDVEEKHDIHATKEPDSKMETTKLTEDPEDEDKPHLSDIEKLLAKVEEVSAFISEETTAAAVKSEEPSVKQKTPSPEEQGTQEKLSKLSVDLTETAAKLAESVKQITDDFFGTKSPELIKDEDVEVTKMDKPPSPIDLQTKEKTVKQGEEDLIEVNKKTAIESCRADSREISKIDKKLQELKTADSETKPVEDKPDFLVKQESLSKNGIDLVDKMELGRKSPMEREQDVAIIVASVAEVLKSDAPLEEFEGKIPLEITTFVPYTPYTTELRETHITTVESPIREELILDKMHPIEEEKLSPRDPISTFLDEERKIAPVHIDYDNLEQGETRVSSLIKDSTELIQATSKIISDIKQSSKVDDEIATESPKEGSPTPPSEIQKALDVTQATAPQLDVESKEPVLEKLSPALDEPKTQSPAPVDVKEEPLEAKEIDPSIGARKSTPDIKEHVQDVLDIGKLTLLSGKSSPETKDLVKDNINVDKSQASSGKSSPETKQSIKEVLDADKSPVLSGKTTPDLKAAVIDTHGGKASPDLKSDLKDVETDVKPVQEQKTVDLKTETKDLHDSSSLPAEKTKADVKESTKDTVVAGVLSSGKTSSGSSGKTTPEIREPEIEEHDEIASKATISSGKSSPEIKVSSTHTVHSETGTTTLKDSSVSADKAAVVVTEKSDLKDSLDAAPVVSGKTTPEIKEPCDDGKTSPEIADTSAAASGKTTPEGLRKDSLAATDKGSVASGKSTPEIVIHEDNGSIGSGRSTPDLEELELQKVSPQRKDSEAASVKTETSSPTQPIEDKSAESGKHAKEEIKDKVVETQTSTEKHVDLPVKISETFEPKPSDALISTSPVVSGKTTPDMKHSAENGTPVDSRKSSLKESVKDASSLSGKSSPELKVSSLVGSGRTTPESKKSIDFTDIPPPIIPDFPTGEIKTQQVSSEPAPKVESLPGPSSSSKTDSFSGLGSSKSPTEDYSRKSTPDIADVAKGADPEESSLGRTTPPTVPVSPVVKEKRPSLHEQEKGDKKEAIKSTDLRSSTPASDDCDISSGQVSRVLTTEEDDDKQVYSDDDDLPGSPLSATSQVAHSTSSQYDFEDSVRGIPPIDPMSTSFYGALPDDPVDLSKGAKSRSFIDESDMDFDKALHHHRQTRGEDLASSSSPSHVYEITTAKYSSIPLQEERLEEKSEVPSAVTLQKESIMTASFIGSELPADPKDDPIASWGKPLGLPSPAPLNDNKGTPKKERKVPPNVMAKNKLNEDKKLSDSKFDKKGRKINPVYVDLTYVPHHGNSNYSYVDFFKRVRARYYVFSGIEPSKEVYNALLEAKQTWDDKELEVTIIPTYDTDVLGYWVAENEDLLAKCKIDLSPSASRCTINLQDHETSCSAYRLEFS